MWWFSRKRASRWPPDWEEIQAFIGDRTMSLQELCDELPGTHFGTVAWMLKNGKLTGDFDNFHSTSKENV